MRGLTASLAAAQVADLAVILTTVRAAFVLGRAPPPIGAGSSSRADQLDSATLDLSADSLSKTTAFATSTSRAVSGLTGGDPRSHSIQAGSTPSAVQGNLRDRFRRWLRVVAALVRVWAAAASAQDCFDGGLPRDGVTFPVVDSTDENVDLGCSEGFHRLTHCRESRCGEPSGDESVEARHGDLPWYVDARPSPRRR